MDMSKYDHVLQPLKQLEEVWGIDLAATLKMYASEVMEVTVEMGGQALNFAQAALLIMGASSIYGKKVDSLQQLVQDTYDLILNRKKEEEAGEKKKKKQRVVLRQVVSFEEASAKISKSANVYRKDVTETMRLILSGSDHLGPRSIARDIARVAEGELVPFENTQSGGFNYRVNISTVSGEGLLLPNVRQELAAAVDYQDEHTTPRANRVRLPSTPGSAVTSRPNITESEKARRQAEDEKGIEGFVTKELQKLIEKELDSESETEGLMDFEVDEVAPAYGKAAVPAGGDGGCSRRHA